MSSNRAQLWGSVLTYIVVVLLLLVPQEAFATSYDSPGFVIIFVVLLTLPFWPAIICTLWLAFVLAKKRKDEDFPVVLTSITGVLWVAGVIALYIFL